MLEGTCDDADARDRYDAVLFCGGFQSVMEPKEALKKVRIHLQHMQYFCGLYVRIYLHTADRSWLAEAPRCGRCSRS